MLGVNGDLSKLACRSLRYQVSCKRLRRLGCHAGHSHRDPGNPYSRGLAAPSLSHLPARLLIAHLKIKAPNRRVGSRVP
jgi:hypothetical protein